MIDNSREFPATRIYWRKPRESSDAADRGRFEMGKTSAGKNKSIIYFYENGRFQKFEIGRVNNGANEKFLKKSENQRTCSIVVTNCNTFRQPMIRI